MSFKIGNKIVFLHEAGGGVIKSLDNNRFSVEDENGFIKSYLPSEIAPVHTENYKLGDSDFEYAKGDISTTRVQHVVRQERSQADSAIKNYWEIDLHIEQLTDSHRSLSNAEIINKQMNAFKVFIQRASTKGVRKIVVIHGVGQGVLKYEVRQYLSQMDDINYYDADFGEYGKGATTIEFYH